MQLLLNFSIDNAAHARPCVDVFNDEKLAKIHAVNSHDLLLRRRQMACVRRKTIRVVRCWRALPGPRCIEKYCCSAHAAAIVVVNELESLPKN